METIKHPKMCRISFICMDTETGVWDLAAKKGLLKDFNKILKGGYRGLKAIQITIDPDV